MNRLALAVVLCAACGAARESPADGRGGYDAATPRSDARPGAPLLGHRVVARHPHDPAAFTQGLVFVDGALLEGTGRYGSSSLRRVDLATGVVLQQRDLDSRYFGEGVTVVGDRVLQLTWQSRTGFIYSLADFAPTGTFDYPTEGWGLAYDGQRLIMSDGSATLYFLDPVTFARIGQVTARDGDQPVAYLNELEVVDGQVLANVWQTDRIARIDPATGLVTAWIDLTGLLVDGDGADVLNGIAYDDAGARLFVTGKLWPSLFEIELLEQP